LELCVWEKKHLLTRWMERTVLIKLKPGQEEIEIKDKEAESIHPGEAERYSVRREKSAELINTGGESSSAIGQKGRTWLGKVTGQMAMKKLRGVNLTRWLRHIQKRTMLES